MDRLLPSTLVVALLLTACGGSGGEPAEPDPEPDETPTAWPDDYATWVCGAIQELQLNAVSATRDLSESAEVLDVDGVADAAEEAADSAKAARGMLELTPKWGPGNGVVKDLHRSTTLFAQGGNLVATGARAGDVATIEEGSGLIVRATRAMGRANDKLTRLQSRTGFEC